MSSNSRCASPDPAARRRALLAIAAFMTAWPVAAQTTVSPVAATPGEVLGDLPGARLQGQGRLRFFGLHVYDIRLWAPVLLRSEDALRSSAALEIEYARSLKGPAIAERSLTEMRRVADIDAADAERWLGQMRQLFPDVQAGDRITFVHRPGEGARFHLNGRLTGEVRDAAFARLFAGIWLSPRTSEPQLRNALLGLSP